MTEQRWLSLMSSLKLAEANETFNQLIDAYSEPHRFYHTTHHIDAMLRHFDEVSELAEYPAELEVAIWFHDAIYKPFSSTNELDSANWASQFLLSQGYNQKGASRVHDLVMATLHNGLVKSQDAKLIVDIDLTILGSKPDVYDEFERNVRKEYKLVPSFIFRKKRKEILQSFLSGGCIYNTAYFKEKFEERAKENINRAIKAL